VAHPYPIREIARQAGLSDADIQTMLVDNPRQALPLAAS